jgi:hypothetical protein
VGKNSLITSLISAPIGRWRKARSPGDSTQILAALKTYKLKVISMSNPELALLRQQMALLETRVKYLEKPLQQQWVTSSKAAQIFAGKMSSYQIRKAICHAIAKPEDSLLIAGTHFLLIPNLDGDDLSQLDGESKNVEYKINIPKWEEWMISTSMSLGTD